MVHAKTSPAAPPDWATAVLMLADGTPFWGRGVGAVGTGLGEVCFNTSMTGYQEILTDPSYAGQIITFTFPHIGNVGTNEEDIETTSPFVKGLILRADITQPSNWRAVQPLQSWLEANHICGIAGIDTRRLTRLIRTKGAPTGIIHHAPDGQFDLDALVADAAAWPGLEGMDLARTVTCDTTYEWSESRWQLGQGYGRQANPTRHVVAIDYGIKRNILRMLAAAGCRVTVVPATMPADVILAQAPDGVFLSNGPGDPAACRAYAVPILKKLLESGVPIFGICLGHQLLALALGAETEKMHLGHRGANQPVKDLDTGKVEITSQNHGFVVRKESLPRAVIATHISLFDGVLEGLRLENQPVFSVQYHPEASPGPEDSHYLFKRFMDLMDRRNAEAH